LGRWIAVALGTAILIGARRVDAEALPGVSVRWSAPSACPTADELEARVHRLLPVDPAAAPATDRLIADGTVEVVNGHYRLKLSVRRNGQPAGVTRVFESETCESLAGAAAVTLALLAGGTSRADAAPPSASQSASPPSQSRAASAPAKNAPPAPVPSEALASTPPAARATHAESPNRPPDRRRVTAYLEGPVLAVDEGMLPSLGSGIGVGGGVRIRGLRVLLTGRLWLPQDSTARSVYAATYERRSGALSGCYGWALGPFDVGPCVALALEDVSASGAGPQVVGDPGHATWVTVGLGARAGWSWSRWAALFLRPSLTFNTSRPTFAIDGVGPLYQVPLATFGVDLGCEWIL
jgi:hypothetical protein